MRTLDGGVDDVAHDGCEGGEWFEAKELRFGKTKREGAQHSRRKRSAEV